MKAKSHQTGTDKRAFLCRKSGINEKKHNNVGKSRTMDKNYLLMKQTKRKNINGEAAGGGGAGYRHAPSLAWDAGLSRAVRARNAHYERMRVDAWKVQWQMHVCSGGVVRRIDTKLCFDSTAFTRSTVSDGAACPAVAAVEKRQRKLRESNRSASHRNELPPNREQDVRNALQTGKKGQYGVGSSKGRGATCKSR